MSWGMIGGAAASAVVGGAMSGGGGSGGGPTQYTKAFTADDGGNYQASFQDGRLDIGMTPQLQQTQGSIMDQFALQSGQTAPQAGQMSALGTGFLDNMGLFSPEAIAQQQYNLMSPALLEQQQQGMLDLESRQFAQGRLGSTGGAQQFGQMQQANQFANNQLMADAFGIGMQGQQQAANLGMQMSQGAPQLQGLYNQMGSPLLDQMGSIQQQGLNLANTAGTFSGVGGQGATTYSPTQQIGAGILSSGVGQMGNALGGLFQQPTMYQNPYGYGSGYSGAAANANTAATSGYAG